MDYSGIFDFPKFYHCINTVTEQISILEYHIREWNLQHRKEKWIPSTPPSRRQTISEDDVSNNNSNAQFNRTAQGIEESLRQLKLHLVQNYQNTDEFNHAVESVAIVTQKLVETSLLYTQQLDGFCLSTSRSRKIISLNSLLAGYRFCLQETNIAPINRIVASRCFIIDEVVAAETVQGNIINTARASFALTEYEEIHADTENNAYRVTFRQFHPQDRPPVLLRRGQIKSCLCISGTFYDEVLQRTIPFQKISNPFVLITHPSLYHDAWSTMLWDINFAEVLRLPFVVPESVPWGKFINALDDQFGHSGRRLTEQNMNYLKTKFVTLRNGVEIVTLDRFCNEVPLQFINSGRMENVSLANWIFNILKLITPGQTAGILGQEWRDNKIIGFLTNEDMEVMLRSNQIKGTFLIRFSEKVKCAVTICYTIGPVLKVEKYGPFTETNLKGEESSLAHKVYQNPTLEMLYPNVYKNVAFKCTVDADDAENDILAVCGYHKNPFHFFQ